MPQLTPAPPARDHTAIPIYKLYGYGNVWTTPDPLFCETIAAQEKLHNWHVAPHRHADLYQILYLESGEVTVHLDGVAQTLGPAHVVLVPQMVVHEFAFRPGSGGYILTLTYALLRELCGRFAIVLGAHPDPTVLSVGTAAADRHFVLTLHQLAHEYRSLHTPQRGPVLETLLSSLLVWIHRRNRPHENETGKSDPGSRHLAHYARLIEEHYRVQHQVHWYARRIGVTPTHLNSIVQTLTEKSALQLIHDRLLLEARRELIYTPRTINIIADSLGFADPAYFTRFFKRLEGMSPKDFRHRQQGS